MKKLAGTRSSRAAHGGALARLRARVVTAEETLRALRNNEIDTVVVPGTQGPQVFTLQGAEHAYRVLIESMNEGALTLTADLMVLYANQSFARLIKHPLEHVTGSSFTRFLSVEDGVTLRSLVKRADKIGAKVQMTLTAADESAIPAQISIRTVAVGSSGAAIGMVVTDLTEARRNEYMLRALTHRVVQAQETERGRIALELHDQITQLLCAIGFRSQMLLGTIAGPNGAAKKEIVKLGRMITKAGEEVERISRNLRPGVLDRLGLIVMLRTATKHFAEQSGTTVNLVCPELPERLPPDIELALYRILQEALKNVEKHGRARHVDVELSRTDKMIRLRIKDDGVGFDPGRRLRGVNAGLGLLGMRERAAYVRGNLRIKSATGEGTEVEVEIPVPTGAKRARHAIW
ncbi:MAG: ATP-binding protein [Opitutus sp.]